MAPTISRFKTGGPCGRRKCAARCRNKDRREASDRGRPRPLRLLDDVVAVEVEAVLEALETSVVAAVVVAVVSAVVVELLVVLALVREVALLVVLGGILAMIISVHEDEQRDF